jgi:hypothetical protein
MGRDAILLQPSLRDPVPTTLDIHVCNDYEDSEDAKDVQFVVIWGMDK